MKRVWVNGTFDVLHPGHIKLLEFAKSQGTHLAVGLDTDERITQNKGEGRPIHTLEHRVFAISSIKYVDEVFTFGTDDELRDLMRAYKPDIHVIGGDYMGLPHKIIGLGIAEDLVFFDRVWDYSSSRIIQNI
jgi:D-beta-D-heptose 7-phosphate kinase/D-beta-D-heptose 1-phosphate adenosyltransferase